MGKEEQKIVWLEECDKSFEKTRQLLAQDVMLKYPNFNKKFKIHADASDQQLEGVLSQDNKPI